MNCGKWIVVQTDQIKKYGGNPVIMSLYVKNKDLDEKMKGFIAMSSSFSDIKIVNRDAHELFDRNGCFDQEIIKNISALSHDECFKLLIESGDPCDIYKRNLSVYVYSRHYNHFIPKHLLTFEEIKLLGNPITNTRDTLAHIMAENGKIFSAEELLYFGNTFNIRRESIAHSMIKGGNNFSIQDIMKLENTQNSINGNTLAHDMVIENGYMFSFDDLMELNNPRDFSYITVAHHMAKRGHVFSDKELELLGDRPTREYPPLTIKETMEHYQRSHKK